MGHFQLEWSLCVTDCISVNHCWALAGRVVCVSHGVEHGRIAAFFVQKTVMFE